MCCDRRITWVPMLMNRSFELAVAAAFACSLWSPGISTVVSGQLWRHPKSVRCQLVFYLMWTNHMLWSRAESPSCNSCQIPVSIVLSDVHNTMHLFAIKFNWSRSLTKSTPYENILTIKIRSLEKTRVTWYYNILSSWRAEPQSALYIIYMYVKL